MNNPNKFTQMNSLIKGNCQILALFPIHEKLEMAFLMSSMFVWKNTKSLKPSKQHEAIGYNETLNVNKKATPWTAAHQAPLSMRILPARTLEWVAFPSSRGPSQPRDQTWVSHTAGRFVIIQATKEAQINSRLVN